MKRLCYLLGDVNTAREAVGALHRAGVMEPNIMVVARDDIALGDLPAANIERTDAMPGLVRGLAAGAVIGAIAGIVAIELDAFGKSVGFASVPIFALAGALVSGFATLLAGASLTNSGLGPLQDAIDRGSVVLMVDVDKPHQEQVEKLMRTEITGGEFTGIDLHVPILPR